MSKNNINKANKIKRARQDLEKLKLELASEIGIPLSTGSSSDLMSTQNGYLGGFVLKRLLENQQNINGNINEDEEL